MSAGEIQRAQLFADVDELLAWKKTFELKQVELLEWQETMLKGCATLVETNELMTTRLDDMSIRIDIANKRLRNLENAS